MYTGNAINNLCEIQYYNKDSFCVGILLYEGDDIIIYYDFNVYGEYNGIILDEKKYIEKVTFNTKYIKMISKVIEHHSFGYSNILSKIDFINEVLKNDRVLALAKKNTDLIDVKVLSFENDIVKYRVYNNYCELLKKEYTVNINNISMMQYDSKYMRMIEKVNKCN